MPTVKIYEASQGKEIDHELEVDQNGEIIATSVRTGHFIKFPAGLTKTQFQKAVTAHKKAVQNQVVRSPEEIEKAEEARKKSEDLLKNL